MNPMNKAIKAKTRDKYISNPILKQNPPAAKIAPKEVRIRVVPSLKRGRMRQYGDKGYRPSDGRGVGH